MSEYINKTTAYEILEKMEEEHNLSFSKEAYHKAAIVISTMPTEDVQPVVHAKWIDNGISESMLYACSNCGFPSGAYSFNYCPKCGSKMRRIYE